MHCGTRSGGCKCGTEEWFVMRFSIVDFSTFSKPNKDPGRVFKKRASQIYGPAPPDSQLGKGGPLENE
jgi:hypothetical protein